MEQKTINSEQSVVDFNRIRTFFLYLLRIFGFALVYIYVSINFKSISQPFIESPSFSIQFSISLFTLAFLSNLFGWIVALIGGVLSETLIHLIIFANYVVYIEWIIIVGAISFLFGIYKYKPLKYRESVKVFKNFLFFVISAFIALALSILLSINSGLEIDSIIIDIGFNFFMQIILSVAFFVPILVFFLDKATSSKEREIYHVLLTHHMRSDADHTFVIKLGRTSVFFCTRCSGMVISLVFTSFLTFLYESITNTSLSPTFAFFMCIILPIPGMIDWCTQKLKFRKSTTNLRLFTGFLIGSALYLLSFTRDYIVPMTIVIAIYFSIFFTVFYIGNKKEIRQIKQTYK